MGKGKAPDVLKRERIKLHRIEKARVRKAYEKELAHEGLSAQSGTGGEKTPKHGREREPKSRDKEYDGEPEDEKPRSGVQRNNSGASASPKRSKQTSDDRQRAQRNRDRIRRNVTKLTSRGQPVMRGRIDAMLQKIKADLKK